MPRSVLPDILNHGETCNHATGKFLAGLIVIVLRFLIIPFDQFFFEAFRGLFPFGVFASGIA